MLGVKALGTATDSYTYPGTSNRLDNITLAAGGSRAFTYDAAGNVTLDNRTGSPCAYTYNAAGRMSEFRINCVLQASYKYDYLGRQAIRSLSGGVTIHSVFDSDGNRIAEYNEATGALIREYVWFNGAPLAVIEGGVTTFIRADHIGRPVFGTNTGGTKVWTAAYLPSGGVRTTTGTPINARFPGQWFQSESGLHQNWMRDYDPTTGRYLQADPLGLVDGASVYGYARQSPAMWTDPTGELIPQAALACWVSPWCRAGVAGAANVAWGWLTDDCYTLEEAGWDFLEGAAIGAGSRPFAKGSEYAFKSGRVAPYGNRWSFPKPNGKWWQRSWNSSNGKWPHYHRPNVKPGEKIPGPGQGVGRHRPWDSSPFDVSWKDRF